MQHLELISDYKDWRQYPILNLGFDELTTAAKAA